MINLPIQNFPKEFISDYARELIQFMNSNQGNRGETTTKFKEYCLNNSINFNELIKYLTTNPFLFMENYTSLYSLLEENTSKFCKKYYELMKLCYVAQNLDDVEKIKVKIEDYLAKNQILNNQDIFFISIIQKSDIQYLRDSIKTTLNKINSEGELNLSKVFDYETFFKNRPSLKARFVKESGITICPYCNRNYTDIYRAASGDKFIAQLDHFYPQSRFPLYALSLANFVPACASCNGNLKKDSLTELFYPYNDKNNNNPHFNITINDFDSLIGNSTEEIKITINKASIFYKNAEMFQHEDIYENHKEHIRLLLKQKRYFGDTYHKLMQNILDINNLSYNQFRELLHGFNPKNIDELRTKPLSKLSHDFLKLIYQDEF